MRKNRTGLLAVILVAVGASAAIAGKPVLDEQLRESLGEGAVQTLDLVKERNPELHTRLRRGLRFLFSAEFGPRRWLSEARDFLADPQAREALAGALDARHKVRKLTWLYDQSTGSDKEALKSKLREAVGQSYDARLALGRLRAKKLEERLQDASREKTARVERIVGLLTEE